MIHRFRKSFVASLVAAAIAIAAVAPAQAAIFVEDNFDTNNGGTGWQAASSWSAPVAGGELNYNGTQQQRLFAAPITATDYWMAVTLEQVGNESSFLTTGAWEGAAGQPYFLGFHNTFDVGSPGQTRFPVETNSNAAPVGGHHTVLFHVQNVTAAGFDYDAWAFSGDETGINPAALGGPNWKVNQTRGTISTTPDRWNISGGISTDFDRIAIADNQFEVLGQAIPESGSIALNFAGAGNNPGGRKAIPADTEAGATGFDQFNWNNTPGTGQTGPNSSANDTMLDLHDNNGLATTLDVTFSSPQTWGTNFGATPTGDQMLKGNSINSGATVTVSENPFATFDLVVYFNNFQAFNGDTTITLTLEGGAVLERFVTALFEQDGSDQGWVEVSDAATSAGARESGNYTVFSGLTGSSFVLTSSGSPGFSGIQLVDASVIPAPAALPAGLAMLAVCVTRRRRHRAG